MPAAACALVFALWPLAARAGVARGAAAPTRPAAEAPPVRTSLRRLQDATAAPAGADGVQWTAPAEATEAPSVTAAPMVPEIVDDGTLSPMPALATLAPIASGALEHMTLDCWGPCGNQAGYCRWCGEGNACCRQNEPSDPKECREAEMFMTFHHECVQMPPQASTSAPPMVTAPAAGVVAPAVTGVPTAAPVQPLVPAAEALLSTLTATTTVTVTVSGAAANASQAVANPLVPTLAPVTVTTTMDKMKINELYLDRRDRFIRAPDGRATWFQDAKNLTKHLVRSGCGVCGSPPPCKNWLAVSKDYIHSLTLGEDFSCEMLSNGGPNGFGAAAFPTTTTEPSVEFVAETTTTTEAAGGGGFGSFFLGLAVVLCCCAGAGGAAFWAMNKGRKASKKGKKAKRGVKADESMASQDEDQVPLVLGQDSPSSFSSQASRPGESMAQMGQRERMAAMAPTFTAMTPQMAQAQMAAQMATQGQMPTQTTMQGFQQPMAMQPGMPTYPAMQTQAAFAPDQEMELVTVTPNGLAVTPLAPGQQVPTGVPVLNQLPPQMQPQYGMQMPGY